MYEGKTSSLFVKYAVPQMIGLLFNSVYIVVDGLFIGNRLGRDAMAAAAVAVPAVEILIALSMAIASGAGILISGQLGRKENEKALQTFSTALVFGGILGVLIALLGNLFLAPLASFLGATPEIQEAACEYLWYVLTFSPFLLFSFLLGALVRNDGRPRLAMAALSFGSILNIILDYVFLYLFDMGIAGAALATAIGPVVSVAFLMPHFLLKRGALYLTGIRPRFAVLREIVVLGFPSFVMEFTIGIVTLVYNFAIVHWGYGELGLAAYLVIGYLMLIVVTIFLGIAEGLQPIFSYFAGIRQQERDSEMRAHATKIVLVIGIVAYTLIVLFGRYFFALFTPDDGELLEFATRRSIPYFCGVFLAGYNILMISFWQSTKRTRNALIVSSARSFVFPPIFVALLPALFGVEALWISHSTAEAATACIALCLLHYGNEQTS